MCLKSGTFAELEASARKAEQVAGSSWEGYDLLAIHILVLGVSRVKYIAKRIQSNTNIIHRWVPLRNRLPNGVDGRRERIPG